MRLNAQNGITVRTIAQAHGVSESAVQHLLTGSTYKDVPCILPCRKYFSRKLTSAQAVQARRMYATRNVSSGALAAEYGIDDSTMMMVLRGYAYKDVPNAVPEHITYIEYRGRRPYRKRVKYRGASTQADSDHRSSSPSPDHPSEADSQTSG